MVLSGALLLWLLHLRLWLLVQQKQRQNALQRWRPLLMSGLYGQPEALPPLSRFDLPHILELWNHLYDSLGIEARNNLNRLAGQARIPAAVSQMLRKRSFHVRYLAARTAGNLQLASAWDLLRDLLVSDSPALSLSAARALTQIDAARAMPLLIQHMSVRNDWHPEAVTEILHIAGFGLVATPLLHAIETASVVRATRLIRYLLEIAPAEAAPLVRNILASPAADEILLNICLDAPEMHESLDAVRLLANHANWHVRVHAAKALGRAGMLEDAALLTNMLGDGQWWVRYRAAQALIQLPGMSANELHNIKDIQTDRDARDMLHLAMAEQELHEACELTRHG